MDRNWIEDAAAMISAEARIVLYPCFDFRQGFLRAGGKAKREEKVADLAAVLLPHHGPRLGVETRSNQSGLDGGYHGETSKHTKGRWTWINQRPEKR
jgi:hypothetical protein